MEEISTNLQGYKDFSSKDLKSCQLFGCLFHDLAFAVSDSGKVISTKEPIKLKFPTAIAQVVVSCHNDPDACHFYLRSVTNEVFEWISTKNKHATRKRIKLEDRSHRSLEEEYFSKITDNVFHIMSFKDPGVILFSGDQTYHYNPKEETSNITTSFNPSDSKITCYQYFKQLDVCFTNFFSLSAITNGLIYGTNEGSVFWRDFDKEPVQDTKAIMFEKCERVKHIELMCVPMLSNYMNTLIAAGERGTIMVYSKASGEPAETSMVFKQFNVPGPIHSFGKAHKNLTYLVCSQKGKVSLLELKCNRKDVELHFTPIHCEYLPLIRLRMCNTAEYTFDSLFDQKSGNIKMMTYKYDPTPVSIANNTDAISVLIKNSLEDLTIRESELKQLDIAEQELTQKLVSTNKTLYALQSINNKRKPGFCNSFESTGFEITMLPITKSESIANCSLHAIAYVRTCIKTSRFLELENWDLELGLFPHKPSVLGITKTVSIVGFETGYENGIELYSMWQRDIEIDLEKVKLPIHVSASLIMSIDQDEPPLRFPVSEMILDDLHFAIPCSLDFVTSIERRGLEEVSQRLMDSYDKQKLFDRSGRYPFARLLRRKSSDKLVTAFIKYRVIHIRCLVDLHMTDESYRAILSNVLNEGRTMDTMKRILQTAEQALFILAAFPGCPIMIKLSRVSATVIDFSIQCIHSPALFKVEATLLSRLFDKFIQTPAEDSNSPAFLKKMRLLEESIFNAQEKYQASDDLMDTDGNDESLLYKLKKSTDLLYDMYNEQPIGHFVI